MLLKKSLLKRFQSRLAAIGTINKGMMILRYLTIAPRLFTLNPMASKTEKEKNRKK